jgi:homoserine kinase
MTARLPFTVSAPASSGNLGPGFDVLAMALELRNRVKVVAGTGAVDVRGQGEGALPTDATNLVARAFERAAGQSIAQAGVDLRCDNDVPPARGLGSSTAAAACGLVAGWTWAGQEWDEERLFDELAALDGHPDNAAACAHGGIVLCRSTTDEDGQPYVDVVPFGRIEWLEAVAVIPDRELATEAARAALPTSYERTDVVRAIGAASLLVGGLLGGHPELVEEVLEQDVVHEPHRAALVPELAEVREATSHTTALGATLSGAGPTVVVWCEPAGVDQAVGSLQIDFPELQVVPLACAADGARVEG